MNRSSKNKMFTIRDIERYHSGQMSAQEMHAIEKAALDDPFLADALEGYQYTPDASADLASLKQRLTGQKQQKPRAFLFRNYNWAKAAGIILVLAGAAWFTLHTVVADKENIALQQANPLPVSDSTKASKKAFTNEPLDTIQTVSTPAKTYTEHKLPAVAEKTHHNHKPASIPSGKEEMPVENIPDPSAQNQAVAKTLSAPVIQETTHPAARARLKNSMAAPVLADSAPPKSYAIQTRPADTIRNFDVVLQEEPYPSKDVVVLEKEKIKPSGSMRPLLIVDTLEPAEGMVNFDEYFASHFKIPDDFKTKPQYGEVQLAFEVNQNGEPVNITVVHSLNTHYDQEAIRLLKEGPKWKKKYNKKGRITIRFPGQN